MSDPYAGMADTYDIMVDWPARLARERPFFAELFREQRIERALDIGCATGHHARTFAELGAHVVGIDPSEPLLDTARALTAGDNPRFVAGGFADLPALTERFDFVSVLGNTLAHVRHARGLRTALRNIVTVLAPGGLLCMQVLNYDRLLIENSRWLPLVSRRRDDRDYLFLREHRMVRGKAEFTLITLTGENGWQQHVERTTHLPLTQDTLRLALQRAGFTRIDCYGSFQRETYAPATSPNLVVLAQIL